MYQYGWLDKVTQIPEGGKVIRSFRYHMGGQFASAYDGSSTETFLWDGLALIKRGTESLINEPAITGGNPVFGTESGVMFNDMLGTTLGIKGESFTKTSLTAFGESLDKDNRAFFTGKPHIGELGYAFLFRNYRADMGKWQTADPLGYPDGWNNFAYVNNGVTMAIDWLGGEVKYVWSGWSVQRTIGVGAEGYVSGSQKGYEVAIIWVSTISWTCDTCQKSGSETYYGRTNYSISSNSDLPLWTAPASYINSFPGELIAEVLGLNNEFGSLVSDLAERAIAANLSQSTVDHRAYNAKPPRPANPSHVCE